MTLIAEAILDTDGISCSYNRISFDVVLNISSSQKFPKISIIPKFLPGLDVYIFYSLLIMSNFVGILHFYFQAYIGFFLDFSSNILFEDVYLRYENGLFGLVIPFQSGNHRHLLEMWIMTAEFITLILRLSRRILLFI